MKQIEIEPAKNQKEVSVPLFETYYMAFIRYEEKGEWYSVGIASKNKESVIFSIRQNFSSTHSQKIISFELPF